MHRALRTYLSAELNVEASKHQGLESLEGAAESMEPSGDKQRLMETYNNVFCPPVRFDFQSHMGDMVRGGGACEGRGEGVATSPHLYSSSRLLLFSSLLLSS